jgi:hypothetical protein
MAVGFSRTFTLTVDSRPTVAFEAVNLAEARQIGRERWLQDDLMALASGGAPLSSRAAKLSVRVATAEEAAAFASAAESSKSSDEIFIAYLIELDRAP